MIEPDETIRKMSCYKCGFQTATADTLCPRCRHRLQTTSSIRIRGGLLVLCGGFLVVFMTYIGIWMAAAFRNNDALHASFTGTREQMLMIIALVGMLILFGVLSLLTGGYFLIFGRRNKWFVRAIMSIGFVLFLVGNFFLWTGR